MSYINETCTPVYLLMSRHFSTQHQIKNQIQQRFKQAQAELKITGHPQNKTPKNETPQAGGREIMPIRLIGLMLLLGACTAAPVGPEPQTPLPETSQSAQVSQRTLRPVKLALRFDQGFKTQCANCKVRYAKIEIKGSGNLSTPIYAQGSDANGYTPIDETQGVQTISALVPEGVNWVAYASLHTTNLPDQDPLTRIGNAFHNPELNGPPAPPGQSRDQVELTLRSLQVAQIVEALHVLDSPKVLSPLDLEKVQQLSDSLLGVQQQPDGTFSFSRMPALDDPTRLLDAQAIAGMLENGQLSEQNPEAAAQVPIEQLLPEPKVINSYRARSMTAGLSKMVMDPTTGHLFSFDRAQTSQRVYSLQTPSFAAVTAPYNLGTQNAFGLRNRYFSLGKASSGGGALQAAAFAYEYTALNTMTLKALNQADGSVLWQHQFNQSLPTDFIPVAQNNGKVYVVQSNMTPAQSGVYAFDNGQLSWSAPIVVTSNQNTYSPSFASAGALSPDGQTLYVIRMSYPPFEPTARLVAISTANGLNANERQLWSLDLGGETFANASPVVGRNGNIYISSYAMPANYQIGDPIPGQLQAISSQGQRLWSQPLASAAGNPPVVDYRQGQDIIYLTTDLAQVLSYSATGTMRWSLTLKGTAGEGPVDSPVIGEDLGDLRTLYQALGNGLIYAIRDNGSSAQNLWAQAPGGKVKGGMVLHQGHLYAPTLDGGEGQFVQLKAIQVHSQNLPPAAPWPITGGNLAASGVTHHSLQVP